MNKYLLILIKNFNREFHPDYHFKLKDNVLYFYLFGEECWVVENREQLKKRLKHYLTQMTFTSFLNEIPHVYLILKNYEGYLDGIENLESAYKIKSVDWND